MAELWSTRLCDCCGDTGGFGNCLYTWCCQSCSFGDNVARMPPGAVCCGGSCYGACCSYCVLHSIGLGFIVHMKARRFLRQKYNLQGGGCKDCLLACFCAPCAIAQEHRELNIRGLGPGGVETKPPRPTAITQPPQMMMMQYYWRPPDATPYPPPPYNQPPPGYGTPPSGYSLGYG